MINGECTVNSTLSIFLHEMYIYGNILLERGAVFQWLNV